MVSKVMKFRLLLKIPRGFLSNGIMRVQLVVHHNALPSFQITPATFVFHDVSHHHAIPLLPAAQGATLLLCQDHCNLFVIIALNKCQKDKTYRLCFFRLNHKLSILQCEEPENIPLPDLQEQPENVQRPGSEVVEKGMLT